ncbi:MAG TPA: sigma 54-interacting transcriptional regulator [Polyangia bacterium]|nr:sigma 54-interacting transcriptional regulator [Polyangia bacterium]
MRTFALPKDGAVTIGRGEGSAVRIDDPSVSRNHAILHVGPRLAIQDLGSANGTMVRDRAGAARTAETLNVRQLLGRQADLAVGDSILFGTASVFVRHKPTVELPDLTTEKPGVIVRDPAMRAIYEQAARAARSPINVLILGETGVGKEVLAKAIHAHSQRSKGPFLGVNCGAMSESLQESELFGYEKGAFTGAQQARAGLFESAAGGTVFLDEVGELSAGTQAKLLRVLEERVVTRLGSNRPRPIDVRIVAATNRDVEADTGAGRFRQDLFFRLNGISLLIPPLRDRPQEIEPFARMFLAAACREIERAEPPALSASALAILREHLWPGNVRELRNAIDRAVVLCIGDTILPEHLPPSLLRAVEARRTPRPPPAGAEAAPTSAPKSPGRAPDLHREINALEKARILDALERFAGNQTSAARMLGISRGTLIARLNDFAIPRPRRREDLPGE